MWCEIIFMQQHTLLNLVKLVVTHFFARQKYHPSFAIMAYGSCFGYENELYGHLELNLRKMRIELSNTLGISIS